MFTNFSFVLMLMAFFLITLLLWANVFYGDPAQIVSNISVAAFSSVTWILGVVALIRQERKASVGQSV